MTSTWCCPQVMEPYFQHLRPAPASGPGPPVQLLGHFVVFIFNPLPSSGWLSPGETSCSPGFGTPPSTSLSAVPSARMTGALDFIGYNLAKTLGGIYKVFSTDVIITARIRRANLHPPRLCVARQSGVWRAKRHSPMCLFVCVLSAGCFLAEGQVDSHHKRHILFHFYWEIATRIALLEIRETEHEQRER